MKNRLTALFCAAVLLFSLSTAHAINAGDVYFTAVNDWLVPLSVDTMPTWVGGRLYVPASTFDSATTGVDLGFFFRQNNNTVTLYTLRQMLVFDLNRGIAYDQHSGESLPAKAVNRNGRIYLPVETVCDFFQLEDSYNYTQYGYLVRIKTAAARLSDARFIDAGAIPMSTALEELLRAQQPSDEPAPPQPVTPGPIQPPKQDEPAKPQTQAYLAFRCEDNAGVDAILDRLAESAASAIFFFDPATLAQQDDLIRRVVGSGHHIGLLASGSTAAESQLALTQGNRLLAIIARTAATAVLAPADQHSALSEDGWACWRETVNAAPRGSERPAAYAQRILAAMGSRRTSRLTLDTSAATARGLPALLEQLEETEHRILLPLETRF